MKLQANQLQAHLLKRTAPVYLLHGEEPLQIMELGDVLRAHAKANGFDERQVLLASDDKDWSVFREAADSLSLFSERRLIEVRMPSGKPGRVGAEVLKQYCVNPPADVMIVITSGKLDRGGTSSAWFKAIDKVGAVLAVWPVSAAELPKWIAARLRTQNLRATSEAVALIAERVEGNMLAASQEVERLALLYPDMELQGEHVLDAVSDSARFSINDLVMASLQGSTSRAVRIVRSLRDAAEEPVRVQWSLAQEVRAGARTAEAHAQGMSLDAALKGAGVWQSRTAPLKQAIARHGENDWLAMQVVVAHIDRQIKGQESGDAWDSLEALCVHLAGNDRTRLLIRDTL